MDTADPSPIDPRLCRWLAARAERAVRRTPLRSCDPEDLVQSVWIRYLETFSEGPARQARPWLASALRMEFIDVLRRESFWFDRRRSLESERLSAGDPPATDPSVQLELRDQWDSLRVEVERMTSPYREIMVLRIDHGWPLARIETWLCNWRPIGKHEAHRLCRIARHTLVQRMTTPTAAVVARSSRGSNSPWNGSPAPLPFCATGDLDRRAIGVP